MDKQKIKEILIKARGLIEKGWIKDDFFVQDAKGNTHYCIMGAVRVAQGSFQGEAAELLGEDDVIQDYRGCLLDFNDDPETTKEDVLALFDRTLAALESPDRV